MDAVSWKKQKTFSACIFCAHKKIEKYNILRNVLQSALKIHFLLGTECDIAVASCTRGLKFESSPVLLKIYLPLFVHFAISWPVLFLSARETEWISTNAIYYLSNCKVIIFLGSIITFLNIRTPFNHSIIIRKGFAMHSFVDF